MGKAVITGAAKSLASYHSLLEKVGKIEVAHSTQFLQRLVKIWYLNCPKYRSSPQRCSFKKVVFKNFAIFTGKRLCWSLLLINLQAWRPETLFKNDSNTGVNLWILRNFWDTYFEDYLRRLLLKVKLNLSKVSKSFRVSKSAAFSITAQTKLLLCKFPEKLHLWLLLRSRKFYIRRNNNKVDSIKTGRIVIAHLLP